ncbi:MAG: alpha/beta hydrolase [Acidobacteriota bacterium]
MTGRLESVMFRGPAGQLEGLWKEAVAPRRGGAVFAHPHPLYGGTLHNKVVYRAARAFSACGWETLRFNFRGVGLSEGTHDEGRGETEDVRAALDVVESRTGRPLLAGGFSFGSAAALRAIRGDERVVAYVGVGFPAARAAESGMSPPAVPSLFISGGGDTVAPPGPMREFVAGSAEVVVIPGADHFFAGRLPALEDAITAFLRNLPAAAVA